MNCCCLIILLLLLGNCNSSCGSSCIEPRRRSGKSCRNICDNDCDKSASNCKRTQTVIRRTECDTNSCGSNMTSDSYGNNRYSMYNMDNDDCGCHK